MELVRYIHEEEKTVLEGEIRMTSVTIYKVEIESDEH